MRYAQKLLMALTACICLGQVLFAAPPIRPGATSGSVLFTLDFNNPAIRTAIEKAGGVIVNEGPDGVPAARFDVPKIADGKTKVMASFVLPAESLRGARVRVTGKVRGDSIQSVDSKMPLPGYLGGKVQVYVGAPSRGKRYLDARSLHNTFSWKEVGILCGIMDDANEAQIRIGVEGASGTFWVSELQMVLVQGKVVRAKPVAKALTQSTTQKRGFMSPQRFRAEDFKDMGALHVNVVRWQMGQQPTDKRSFEAWFAEELDELALALDAAAANGIQLVVDMHTAPGGRLPDRTYRMYMEQQYRDLFIQSWEQIARRFKGHPGLWAYDLANEPVQNYPSPAGMPDWLGLQVEAGKAIRAIDPDTAIMIEVDQWDSPDSFAWLQPVDLSNVIYQAHLYWPWEFTHQGIKTNQGGADGKDFDKNSVAYPGTLDNQPLDKEALRRYLEPVREFQLEHGARIFIGEFSAVRWAPGAAQYLDDSISIFEEYGWDWTYHAFRESPVWSVEHENLPYDTQHHIKAVAPTDRLQILQKWFARNRHPVIAEAVSDFAAPEARDGKAEQPVVVKKMLVLGNSISKHSPSKKLQWTGNWGMAASSEDKDYVHVLLAKLCAAQDAKPELIVRGAGGGTIADHLVAHSAITTPAADLVIIQLGENDRTVTVDGFQKPYEKLIAAVKEANPAARVYGCGCWGKYALKSKLVRNACRSQGAVFVDIDAVSGDPACSAASEKRFTNAGVNWHPGDKGMQGYADAIWNAIRNNPVMPPAQMEPELHDATEAMASAPVGKTNVIFAENFDGSGVVWRPAPPTVEPGFDGNAAAVESADTKTSQSIQTVLPVGRLQGRTITLTAKVKAVNVSNKPANYNGIKFMLRLVDAEGEKDFPQAQIGVGSFDWKNVSLTRAIPENTVSAQLVLGLERVSGKVWFDDVQVMDATVVPARPK